MFVAGKKGRIDSVINPAYVVSLICRVLINTQSVVYAFVLSATC